MRFVPHRDSELSFPSATIVNASAGSGKTYNLTLRLVQFLLSDAIPRNTLKNILAVTFTNNAVREMRDRVMKVMKQIALRDPAAVRDISALLSVPEEIISARAGRMVDLLLDQYSDFQVRTIDSFLTMIFRECAIDYGFQPDAQIALGDYRLVDTAFDLFLRDMERAGKGKEILQPLVDLVQFHRRSDSSFIWDPYRNLARYVKELQPFPEDSRLTWSDRRKEIDDCLRILRGYVDEADGILRQHGLDPQSRYVAFRDRIRTDDYVDLIERAAPPLAALKPTGPALARYREVLPAMEHLRDAITEELDRLVILHARSFYQPYLRAISIIGRTLEEVKKRDGVIFLDDVHVILSRYIAANSIPDVYLRLGETLYHFLIDEFQDTSPLQWATLKPLVDNSLAEGGSLFVVGDPKQSIYGFRGADWRIMTSLEQPGAFPSARTHEVASLEQNHRSGEHIVEFTKEVFQQRVPEAGERDAAAVAGLLDYTQTVLERFRDKGYVEVTVAAGDTDAPPEKERVRSIVADLLSRNFHYRDIAIVTPANDDVIRLSSWLSEFRIPFVSHSSLDIRRRTSVGEMISLLGFLDSPVDNLAFANVVLGSAFTRWAAQRGVSRDEVLDCFLKAGKGAVLYTHVRDMFPALWGESFERLLKVVGYLPLYDLLTDCYATFQVFEHQPAEEASLARLAEVVREYEGRGTSNIRDFLEFTDDEAEASRWEMDVPIDLDAIRVMTVHKAKGLGFPVTVAVLYDRDERLMSILYGDLGEGTEILRITKKMADRVPALAGIYDDQALRNRIEDLNMLYVALSRAEYELYVIAVKTMKETKPPVLFLPEDGYHRGRKDMRPEVRGAPADTALPLLHHSRRATTEVTPSEFGNLAEKRRGEYVHLLLAGIEYLSGPAEARLSGVLDHQSMPDQQLRESAQQAVLQFLPEAGELFMDREGRSVQTEQTYASSEGHVYRMDRVIVDPGEVTVVDFKTGGMDGAHEVQVRRYMELLREVFPGRAVHGILAYVDRRILREVR